jgi:hypothetical protein
MASTIRPHRSSVMRTEYCHLRSSRWSVFCRLLLLEPLGATPACHAGGAGSSPVDPANISLRSSTLVPLERNKIYVVLPDKDAENDGDIRVVEREPRGLPVLR